MEREMKYKVLYICYLTRKGTQRQKAYISKATEDVRIKWLPSRESLIPKELHMPLVEVVFFKTKEDALKDARACCYPDDIFEGTIDAEDEDCP